MTNITKGKQMRSKSMITAFIIALTSALSGCSALSGQSCEQMQFASIDIGNVTNVRLHKTNGDENDENLVSELSEREDIQSVFGFLTSRESQWRADAVGVPVGGYRIVFWQDDNRLGSVSFGKDFLVGQGCGYFFAANVGSNEILELATLLGVSDPLELEH